MATPINPGTSDHDHDQAAPARALIRRHPCLKRAGAERSKSALARLVQFADLAPDRLVLDRRLRSRPRGRRVPGGGPSRCGIDLSAEMVGRDGLGALIRRASPVSARLTVRPGDRRARTIRRRNSRITCSTISRSPRDSCAAGRVLQPAACSSFAIMSPTRILPSRPITTPSKSPATRPTPATSRAAIGRPLRRCRSGIDPLRRGTVRAGFRTSGLTAAPRAKPRTPSARRLLSGPVIRTFRPIALPGCAVRIDGIRASVRGEKF